MGKLTLEEKSTSRFFEVFSILPIGKQLYLGCPLGEHQRRPEHLSSVKAFLSHTLCFMLNHQSSNTLCPLPLGLSLDTEWVTLLFTIFQIPSQVFALAGCSAFSLAITGLRGFSNGAFEEITLYSLSSREKTETFGQQLIQSITQTQLELGLTHLATKIS